MSLVSFPMLKINNVRKTIIGYGHSCYININKHKNNIKEKLISQP